MTYCIINSTASNKDEALKISEYLVKNKLIACCNIIENVTSVYYWGGNLNIDNEVLMIMKTKTELYDKVEKEIKKMHGYDVPEIVCTPLISGNKDYLNWIDEQTRG